MGVAAVRRSGMDAFARTLCLVVVVGFAAPSAGCVTVHRPPENAAPCVPAEPLVKGGLGNDGAGATVAALVLVGSVLSGHASGCTQDPSFRAPVFQERSPDEIMADADSIPGLDRPVHRSSSK
jgi:hypothetical protein